MPSLLPDVGIGIANTARQLPTPPFGTSLAVHWHENISPHRRIALLKRSTRVGNKVGLCADNDKREDIAVGGKQRLWGKIKGAVCELAGDVVILCSHPVYLSTVAGQTLYTGEAPLRRLAAVTPGM